MRTNRLQPFFDITKLTPGSTEQGSPAARDCPSSKVLLFACSSSVPSRFKRPHVDVTVKAPHVAREIFPWSWEFGGLGEASEE